jgi:hypothetical protein
VRRHEPFWKGVKPGDIVRRGSWGSGEPEYGRVLAIAPVAGRDWPDVLVILPGGDVQTWHRWGKVGEEEAGELAWMWKRSARQ